MSRGVDEGFVSEDGEVDSASKSKVSALILFYQTKLI